MSLKLNQKTSIMEYAKVWQTMHISDPENTSKVSDVSNSDARCTSYEIARMTSISEASARMILKKNLEFTRKVSWCITHILTNEQKAARRK